MGAGQGERWRRRPYDRIAKSSVMRRIARYCSDQNKFSTKTASSYGYGDQSYVALWWIVEIVWCCSLVSRSICFGEGISRTSRYMI